MKDRTNPVPDAKKHAPRGRIKANPMDAPDLMDAPHGKNYEPCVGTSKQSKKRCLRRPIPGGTVCVIHGGGAPQVQLAAAERLKALEIPALIRLEELMQQKEFPSVAIAAVKDALDRIRGKAIEQQILEHKGGITIRHEMPDDEEDDE